MSETPKDEKPFSLKKAGLIAAGVIGTAGYLVTQAGVNAHNDAIQEQQARDEFQQSQEAAEQRADTIRAAIEKQYDSSAVVGSFLAETDPTLIASAESILKESLGDEVYNDNIDRWYDDLLASAKIINAEYFPQPGETIHVVETDLDGNPDNGNEYIVTPAPGGIASSDGTIPSPVTR